MALEYLVQNTQDFAPFSKDNYLQGLENNGPNIWLNFDNAGTEDYGTIPSQDISQRWKDNMFDYKTHPFYEHPTANCGASQPSKAGHFAGCRISFRGMGPNTYYGEPSIYTKDDLDLLGFSVATSMDGIDWTYAFYFVTGTSNVSITKDESNHTIQILTGLDGCDNGQILSQRIVAALSQNQDIINLKEVFAHPNVHPNNPSNPWTIGQDEIIFWNSEHFGKANGFEAKTLKQTLKLEAVYNGPSIMDNNHYDVNDVDVYIIYTIPGSSNTKKVLLSQDEYTLDSTLVLDSNSVNHLYCEFTATYIEKLYGDSSEQTFTATFQVPLIYLKKLVAEYKGPIIEDKNHYSLDDVEVYLVYANADNSIVNNVYLNSNEYSINSTLVLKENAIDELYCEFIVSYKNVSDTIEVPILYLKEFKAIYTGPYIYIVSDYDINDVTVDIIFNRPEYSKTLDPSEYDLSTMTIDKLGVNTITVTEHSKGYTTTFIVIGVRIVLDINARYIGPPIEIMEKYDPLDVVVELDTVDENHENRMTVILKYSPDIITMIPGVTGTNEYLIQDPPGLYIYSVGDNIRTVFYKDPLIEATTEFIVPGIPKLVDFETTYIGDTRIIGERIYNSEVLAMATWITEYDGIDCTLDTKILEDDEWEFYDAPIINHINKGYFRTKYKSLFSSVKIKYDSPNTLQLRCWYEGAKIEVGNIYDYEDVAVFLVLPNEDLKRLRVSDCNFSDNFVTVEGWNYYTVTYETDYYILSGVFAVPGYIPIVYPDVDFMVRYIDIPNNYREIDYTEKFRPKFTVDGVFVISWKQFLEEVNELMLYGLYILTAPKCTGLSNKYDQDWEVLCINKTTLKANIMKIFLKEEDLPWQKQNQQKH